ncbi:ImmA/IrrE family metallo-endopeptidase [Pseudoclavibacter helvolus]|uniref:Zn-dependent peptidase ImmA (M78 family) n=1 Tax=Pseudoclavibacter helvolus TaxID=255205 RepID=A0A7W4UM54_9MICO|nr:Zn-dependent peptidase ImmA (M78 family) [Pseudoclavibacter helvolus]
MYDPHQHAHELKIPVVRHPLRASNGMWLPDQGVILLKLRMRSLMERNVLAHEIAHAVLGHGFQECGTTGEGRQEHRANSLAATWLVDDDHLRDLQRTYDDPGRWCAELSITPAILRAHLAA